MEIRDPRAPSDQGQYLPEMSAALEQYRQVPMMLVFLWAEVELARCSVELALELHFPEWALEWLGLEWVFHCSEFEIQWAQQLCLVAVGSHQSVWG